MTIKRSDAPQRLFIALWPSRAAARQLAAMADVLHAACGGRKIPSANQHITLAFLGNVAPKQMAEVEGAMRSATGPCFDVRLDGVEYRKRGGMWWARATQVDPALELLVRRLREMLQACDLRVEHRAFVPHVTLLRDARPHADLPVTSPLTWRAREFTLVRSRLERDGARYEVILRVALARSANAA